ncbi:hypothetical protein OSB04_004052 [Centaurea solstitialis]|uniref:Calmodulin binding protein-like N-terminal domain-containing protein n=1 Tax=Centaurea solstitialis TaxID=347529 RepID=A0AA38WVV2_9ASTR|nr:hypothetical protein OSB04_004052 [Centaurea solstitialis]
MVMFVVATAAVLSYVCDGGSGDVCNDDGYRQQWFWLSSGEVYRVNEESMILASGSLKLMFLSKVTSPVFTGKKMKGEAGNSDDKYEPIKIVLVENGTNQPLINSTFPASLKVMVVLLPAEFGSSTIVDSGTWTSSEFKDSVITNWENKKDILRGDPFVDLKNGSGIVGEIWIKHDKKHLRKCRFRLGAMVVDSGHEIKEAITEPFEVQDRRNELTSKRRPVSLHDNIYGSSGKMWEDTVRHAKTSIIDKRCNLSESVGSTSRPEDNPSLVDHAGFVNGELYMPSGIIEVKFKTLFTLIIDGYNEPSASSNPTNLKLIFPDDVASPVFTRIPIGRKTTAGDGGNESIRVFLVNTQTNQLVTTGPAASATLSIVLLPADFDGSKEFQQNIITERGKKKNLLQGNPTVVLKDGIGTVGEIHIKHDSKPLKNDRFRLGAMVVGCADRDVVIQEAVSGPFEVKDRRNTPKALRRLLPTDKLCCLKSIGKKSPVLGCMKKKGVLTVSDFIAMLDSDPQGLQKHNGYGSVGSISQQQSTNMSVFYDGNPCYKPMPCHENNISVQDYEENGLVLLPEEVLCFEPFLEDRIGDATTRVSDGGEVKVFLAKKRWKKVRATLWFSLLSCLKAGFGTVGSTLATCAGLKVGATLDG